jgi:hypothetical protein
VRLERSGLVVNVAVMAVMRGLNEDDGGDADDDEAVVVVYQPTVGRKRMLWWWWWWWWRTGLGVPTSPRPNSCPFLGGCAEDLEGWSGQKGNNQLEELYGYGNNAIRDDTGGRWFALFQDKREGREGMKKKERG